MMRGSLKVFFAFIVLFFVSDLKAQEGKRISFNGYGGLTLLPGSEKLNNAKQATNIFGKYPPAVTAGLGVNYRFNPNYSLSNNLFFFFSSKTHYTLSASGLRTAINFYPLKDVHKFNPFVSAGLNLNLLNISRKMYSQTIFPDSNANVIGAGIGVTKVDYNYDNLKLKSVPVPGVTLGGGIAYRVSDKVNIFLNYSYNYNFAKHSGIIKDNYTYNKSNLSYHSLNAGVTLKLLKPGKQMLASLTQKDWDGDPTVSVRGVIVYKKERKSNQKVVPVELVKDTVLTILPTDIMGSFEYKNLRPEDYFFMLARKNKKIERADLQIIHDNSKVDILDEYPTLEMIEDYDSDNIISRDNNFSVNLREGFQHEVDITVLGGDVIGRVKPISYDTLCRNMLVLLKNMQDSVLAVSQPEDNCSYTFSDVAAGPHKIVFVNRNGFKDVKFSYAFEKNLPLIRRQYNTEEDSLDYDDFFEEELTTDNVDINEILLSKRYDKTVGSSETSIALSASKLIEKTLAKESKGIDGKLTDNSEVKDKSQVVDKMVVPAKDQVTETDRVKENNEVADNGRIANDSKVIDNREVKDKNQETDISKITNNKQATDNSNVQENSKVADNGKIANDSKVIDNREVKDKNQETDISKITNNKQATDNSNAVDNNKVADNTKVIDEGKSISNSSLKKITIAEMQTGNNYSPDGEEKYPEGYGVQIGAFSSSENVNKVCAKYRKRRNEPIFIQVINQSENNYNSKLYRIIVGDYSTIEEASKETELLKKAGFDTVLRKHKRFTKTRGR